MHRVFLEHPPCLQPQEFHLDIPCRIACFSLSTSFNCVFELVAQALTLGTTLLGRATKDGLRLRPRWIGFTTEGPIRQCLWKADHMFHFCFEEL